MKQETLEEAAERLYPINNTGSMFIPSRDEVNNSYKQEGFIEGYKLAQETHSNSDEDMIEFVNWAFKDENPFIKHGDKWIQACGNSTSWTTKELLQLWKEQKPKTLYYE